MAGLNAGNPAFGNMPMPPNGPNGGMRISDERIEETNYEGKLNMLIYGYLCHKGQYEAARAFKNSGMPFDPAIGENDVNGVDESMHTDSKDNIDKNRPDDLPDVNKQYDGQGGTFLLSWFAIFWDIYFAQRKDKRASNNSMQFIQQSQQQARLRQDQHQRMFQNQPMMGNMGNMQDLQMMRFQNGLQNDNLRQRALQNTRMHPTPQQIQQMRVATMGQARRDGALDMNGQRPRTPSAGDHAPSPSKRQRMDGVQFDGSQMMPNGRGHPQGMPPGMMGGGDVQALNANNLLMTNGINPGNLSDTQFASFQQQNQAVQQKSIQVYAQNLAKNQRQQSMSLVGGISDQGSPIMDPGMGDIGNPEFYGANNPAAMQMRGGAPANVPNGGAGGNHALQDYQMQLMLLEQQNKKRLLMARQEQDMGGRPDGQPGMPGGPNFVQGMSPGSRGGPSPGPNDTKRGTPKMNQVGLPGGGSPMPDGSMRGSPAAMNFNPMNPDMYGQMNGNNMRPPPSSNPGFTGQQLNPQQMEQFARQQAAGRGMPNGWQPSQGQPPMMGQPQPQQPAPMGTPQTRNNEMPPPQAVPNSATNGRPTSPSAPPTPQPGNKAAPKGKKEPSNRKRDQKPPKKNSMASVGATPAASEAETANPPTTPTPATPSTPQNPNSFAPKPEGQGPANVMQGMVNGGGEHIVPQQPDPGALQFDLNPATDDSYNITFNNDLSNPDLLENFDFEQFLQNTDAGDFNFDPVAFDTNADNMEASMTGT
ncbi:hypothetical protein ACLMJK_008442 [Lecanora helva]